MSTAAASRLDAQAYDGPPPPAALRLQFPRMMAYLDALPNGIHSYPQCQARSGILLTFLKAMPPLAGEMDPFVVNLLRQPSRAWLPEAALFAALLAMGDATRMSDAAFLEWNRTTNRELYRGLLYRALMAIFSPLVLLERAPSRWESFHQGTTLSVRSTGPTEARVELQFPERLLTPLLLRAYATAFSSALEHARARDVGVELAESSATRAEFVARWG